MNLTAIVAAVAFAMGAGCAYKLTADHWHAREAKAQQAAAQAYQARTTELNDIAAQLEKARNDRKIVYRTITRNVQTYIDRPIYVRDCIDSDGLSDINAALAGATSASEPAPALPATPAAGR